MTERTEPMTPGKPKILVCAMSEDGRVLASMRVDPVDEKVDAARDVMQTVSPLVGEKLVHAREGDR